MWSYLALIFVVLIVSVSLSLLFKSNFGKLIPYSCLSIALALFVFTVIFSSFKIACIAIYVCSIILFIITFVPNKNVFVKKIIRYCKNGILTYVIMVVLASLLAFNYCSEPLNWDDYMNWGPMIKNIYNTDYFYITQNSKLYAHPEYPPLISMFITFGIVFEPEFNAIYVFASMFILQSVMLSPIISEEKFSISSLAYSALIISFIYLFEIGLGNSFFFSISQDCIMGLIAGLALYNVLKSKVNVRFWLSNIILSSSLLMIKQFGIVFVFIINVIILFKLFQNRQKYTYKTVLIFVSAILLSFIPVWTWNFIYITSYIGANFNTQFDISNFVVLLSSPIETIQDNFITISKYFWALFLHSLIPYSPLTISYVAILVLFPFIVFLTMKQKSKSLIIFSIIFTLVAYSIFLCLCYMFIFTGSDKQILASVDRYLCSAILSVFVCVFLYFVNYLNKKNLLVFSKHKWAMAILLFPVIFYLLFPSIFSNNINFAYPRSLESEKIQKIIADNCQTENDVLVVDQELTPKDIYEISYNLDKNWISYLCTHNTTKRDIKYFCNRRDKTTSIKDFIVNSSLDFYLRDLLQNEDYIVTGKIPQVFNDSVYNVYGQRLDNGAIYVSKNNSLTKIKDF